MAMLRTIIDAAVVLVEQPYHVRRRLEISLLCRVAHKRLKEVVALSKLAGAVFAEKDEHFSGVGFTTHKKSGFSTNINGSSNPICWEAPIGITIFRDHKALFGLGVEFRGNALCIRQMQCASRKPLTQDLTDWPKTMVEVCRMHAIQHRLKEVRVYKADQCLFYQDPFLRPHEGETHAQAKQKHQQRMRRRYDGTARQLGFEETRTYYIWKNPDHARP